MFDPESAALSVAADLLDIGAVTLSPNEPFTWSSGLKSPIYCDNRLTISYPEVRDRIAGHFAAYIRERCPDAEIVAGIATGGIPHAAWVAQKLQLPMVYVRGKAKGHGKGRRIEGVLRPGQKTVVIEDLVSTGASSLDAALALREAGAEILAVLAVFTYEFDEAAQSFREHGIPLDALCNYRTMIPTALSKGLIREEDVQLLNRWRENRHMYGS